MKPLLRWLSKGSRPQPFAQRLAPRWATEELEPRLLLAGDAGLQIAAAVAGDVAGDVAGAGQGTAAASVDVVVIDSRVDDAAALSAATAAGTHVVWVTPGDDAIGLIEQTIADLPTVDSLHLVSHAASGGLQLGDRWIDAAAFQADGRVAGWAERLSDSADVLVYGCDAAAGPAGAALVAALADLTGADVAASIDRTGSAAGGGDWDLEVHLGQIESSLAFTTQAIGHYRGVMGVQIRAAGSTGQETMQLRVDGQVVRTWENVGGNADAGQFQTFNYNVDGLSADRISIGFTNDLYQPGVIDRNLRVDRIVVDGATFQTEAASTFSTGSWRAEDGIQPGFRRSEYLNANGTFQYAASSAATTEIAVRAAGAEGSERMALRIDGDIVATWDNVGGDPTARQFGTYRFTAAGNVAADRVSVSLENDSYIPGRFDRNLVVDSVQIGGATYQAESETTFSTGTWTADDGIVAGFGRGEYLNANGSFTFQDGLGQPGSLSLSSSQITADEDAPSVTLTIRRTGGSDGITGLDYSTIDGTAIAGRDYVATSGSVFFAAGETQKQIVVPLIGDSLAEGTETFNFVIDRPRGTASLLAPRTATVTLTDNDAGLPNYNNFSSTAGLTLSGAATKIGNEIAVTPDELFSAGSVFTNAAIAINSNTSFQTAFTARIGGGSGTGGADGMTFTIQNAPAGAAAIGETGGGLGYSGIASSVAIELDTYQNAGDINGNHVSVVVGSTFNSIASVPVPFDLNNDQPVYVWIDYNGPVNQLAVYLSQTNAKPVAATLVTDLDLAATVGTRARFGFTAGTGGLDNIHRVSRWSLILDTPPPVSTGTPSRDVSTQTILTGLNRPTAIDWSPDGANLYVAQQDGLVAVSRRGGARTTFIDIRDQTNGTRDRGLLDIAVHPDFQNNPYVYLLYTYDPPQVYENTGNALARPDGKGNRAGRLVRVTADAATNYTTAVAGSEVVLLGSNSTWNNFNAFANSTFDFDEPAAGYNPDGSNIRDFIASDSESHTVGALAFGPDGALYVTTGDGASYNRVDPRAVRVQDIDNLSGKVLRIDPITGQGLADNPFYDGDAGSNRSKVYQYGLRNPFRMAIDQSSGQVYVGDVGWTRWEEVNASGPGANYGWPYYEGGDGQSLRSGYDDLPEARAFYASGQPVDASLLALNHGATGINAIVMGDIITSDTYGSDLNGAIVFNDLGQGIVRFATINPDGSAGDINTFATGANVVVQIRESPDGDLYYVDLDDGRIGRWDLV